MVNNDGWERVSEGDKIRIITTCASDCGNTRGCKPPRDYYTVFTYVDGRAASEALM